MRQLRVSLCFYMVYQEGCAHAQMGTSVQKDGLWSPGLDYFRSHQVVCSLRRLITDFGPAASNGRQFIHKLVLNGQINKNFAGGNLITCQ